MIRAIYRLPQEFGSEAQEVFQFIFIFHKLIRDLISKQGEKIVNIRDSIRITIECQYSKLSPCEQSKLGN